MPHPRIANEVIDSRGKTWYELHLRDIVETDENIGKQIVIDIETGEYEIDDSRMLVELTHGDAMELTESS